MRHELLIAGGQAKLSANESEHVVLGYYQGEKLPLALNKDLDAGNFNPELPPLPGHHLQILQL